MQHDRKTNQDDPAISFALCDDRREPTSPAYRECNRHPRGALHPEINASFGSVHKGDGCSHLTPPISATSSGDGNRRGPRQSHHRSLSLERVDRPDWWRRDDVACLFAGSACARTLFPEQEFASAGVQHASTTMWNGLCQRQTGCAPRIYPRLRPSVPSEVVAWSKFWGLTDSSSTTAVGSVAIRGSSLERVVRLWMERCLSVAH